MRADIRLAAPLLAPFSQGLRLMAIEAFSAVMPMLFGPAGAVVSKGAQGRSLNPEPRFVSALEANEYGHLRNRSFASQ